MRRTSRILTALISSAILAQAQDRPAKDGLLSAAARPSDSLSSRLKPEYPPGSPGSEPAAAEEGAFTPTWETQKNARTHLLTIPAPRGQIVDRNGKPLAQSRVSQNLAISFPTPLNFTDREVTRFFQQQVALARSLMGRAISVSAEQALKHYKNRGVLPLTIAQDLKPAELEAFHAAKAENLVLQPTYQRFYPNGALAGHVLGYAGRSGRMPDSPIVNNEVLWPNAEGREGLEQTFDAQLQGKMGQFNLSFDATGTKVSEQISIPPQAGYNVVTTLDENIQRLCEETLQKSVKRGAIVVMDPNTGDVLALASWPTLNPNAFVPFISENEFKALQEDPNIPLLPRAFRSAYPPGSVYKCYVGMAALNTGTITPNSEFACPPSMSIGNLSFRNHKRTHQGSLNFADALAQSCNTWFYQVGIRTGAKPIIDMSLQLGLGEKTGIPIQSETDGRIPTEEYWMKAYKRKFLQGDLANLSIGQGDTLVSPLQMAQAMAVIGNGGTLFQTRLVQQVQSIDGQIVTAYNVRAKGTLPIDGRTLETVKRGMIQVVSGRGGTAGRAAVPGFQVAGKTGTAQWGPKKKERTAAWFAGFVPAENPKYAFAAVYEGDVGSDIHGGTDAAPMIGKVMRELFKDEPRGKAVTKKKKAAADDDLDDEADEETEVVERVRRRPRREYAEEMAPPPRPQPQRRAERQPFWRRVFRVD